MLYIDSLNWVKFAFENSDATGPSIVTVVTKGTSDDANGVVIHTADELWLAMVRKNHICAMHWSIDGENYHMARLTSIPVVNDIKIGVEAQSPVGTKAKHNVLYFSIEPITIDNLRDINP
jgi:regulation of enolase protein 1 (concanavalin A-like superfamily)